MAEGWVFAVGAGRLLDYRVIAAPDVLVEDGDHGTLAEVVRPDPTEFSTRCVALRTARGRHVALAYRTHAVTVADVDPDAAPGDDGLLRDEFGRPLRLVFGIAVLGDGQLRPDPDDFEPALRVALDAYRAFLLDESTDRATATSLVPLRSHLLARDPAARQEPVPAPSRTGSGSHRAAAPPRAASPTPGPSPRPAVPLRPLAPVAVLLVAVVAVFALIRSVLLPPERPERDAATEAAVVQYGRQHRGEDVRVGRVLAWEGCEVVEIDEWLAFMVMRDGAWRMDRLASSDDVRIEDVKSAAQCRRQAASGGSTSRTGPAGS